MSEFKMNEGDINQIENAIIDLSEAVTSAGDHGDGDSVTGSLHMLERELHGIKKQLKGINHILRKIANPNSPEDL